MKKGTNGQVKAASAQGHTLSVIVAIANIVLLALAVLLYSRYTAVYQERLREENLGNIRNLNRSAAINATALIDSWDMKLQDVSQYAERRGMTHAEALAMIEDSNSSTNRHFQLIGSDYCGYVARRDENGAYIPVSYKESAYAELQRAFDDRGDAAYQDVCITPEFTDSDTALKCFAVYRHLTLTGAEGLPETYTLLLGTRASDLLTVFNGQNDFVGQSTTLMDAKGNYIVSSSVFKSTNFFHYLYVYNDLSLDMRKAIEEAVENSDSGELYYRNAMGQDCVFRYARMETNDWYCVTGVPIASFRTPVFSVNYAMYAVFALVLMLAIDVAWLQRMNSRLRVSMQREKEASEAKTAFLSRMSHDIRTPLNGIIGLATLALDEENPPKTREYLDHIEVSGQFLSGLVNDILDLSRVESGKVELHPEPYSSSELIRYVEAVMKPLCRDKGLELRISSPDTGSPVLLDRLRFNQVVFNLLSNAVKYTPSGGLVELYWTRNDLPEGRVVLEVTVRDNGIGISEEFQKHMFESFAQERTQAVTIGSGLGLAIVKSLVKIMHGNIHVTSKQGVGSTFTVQLETTACSMEAPAVPEVDATQLDGLRVLVCEDNSINVLVVQRLLEKWGMRVETAENGAVGLRKFAESAPYAYDLILMDVLMPEMNGLDATRAIRQLQREDAATVPIIAMTANAYDTDVRNCLDAGMNAHMGKPIDHVQLKALLSGYAIQVRRARQGTEA